MIAIYFRKSVCLKLTRFISTVEIRIKLWRHRLCLSLKSNAKWKAIKLMVMKFKARTSQIFKAPTQRLRFLIGLEWMTWQKQPRQTAILQWNFPKAKWKKASFLESGPRNGSALIDYNQKDMKKWRVFSTNYKRRISVRPLVKISFLIRYVEHFPYVKSEQVPVWNTWFVVEMMWFNISHGKEHHIVCKKSLRWK